MDLKYIKKEGLLLLDCISGSKAYALDTAQSDTDKRGVFYMPRNNFFGLEDAIQVSNDSNDESYSELGRFFALIVKSNPTMIELLNTPRACVLTKHPIFDKVLKEDYLSKQCKDTFAGYAVTQIRKAKGLKKKISNPVEPDRKSVLDFCFVPDHQGSIPLQEFLKMRALDQSNCGLAKVPHMHDIYGLYYSENSNYKGVVQKDSANEVSLSSIPKGEKPITLMSFNKSGYSSYCKEYKEYWQWVKKRNDLRYQYTLQHGKNYDAKNMMHTFRLLAMAQEIGALGEVNVKRPDRAFLLKVRSGEFEYEELLLMAEERIQIIEDTFATSSLPDKPNADRLNNILVEFRETLYLKK